MIKILRAIAVIAVCATIIYLANMYQNKTALQKEIDTTKTTIVTQLVSLNNMETAKMSMQKIVEGKQWLQDLIPGKNWDNTIQNFFFEDSIKITAYADIIAGFDLTTLTTGAINLADDKKTITLTLPTPKILHASLTKETKPFVRTRWILSAGDLDLETDVRNKTLEKMTQEAIDNGILIQAQKNAQTAFSKLLEPLGYSIKEVVIQTGGVQL